MEWLNFRHLYAFWMVAKEGSFTRAAEKMFVAQSAVSSQVSALEAYMRQRLLNRTPRSVELTPAGRHLLDYAQAIFAQSRAINALIQDPEVFRNKHRLRLGLVGGVSRYFVYRFLEHLGRKDPDLQVSVTDGSYDELFGMLWRFELDAIITLEPPHKKDMGEVYYRKLGESDLCVVGVPALISEIRSGARTLEVPVYKFRHPYEVDVLAKHVRPRVQCPLMLRLDTDDIPLLRYFATSGAGLAVLPRAGVLKDLAAGTVEALDLPQCPGILFYGITLEGGQMFLEREDFTFP